MDYECRYFWEQTQAEAKAKFIKFAQKIYNETPDHLLTPKTTYFIPRKILEKLNRNAPNTNI